MTERTFQEDVEFLIQYVDVVVLGQPGEAQVVVVPQYQGRTMTSTTGDRSGTPGGKSCAWINYDLIESQKQVEQINLYGGEDRFWISPEGGQFSVFFDPGSEMDFAHWRTPEILDTEPFELVAQSETQASFRKHSSLQNFSGFTFEIGFDRTVELLDQHRIESCLGAAIGELSVVGHESRNTLSNTGKTSWEPETGLLGIWMLCMNRPSPKATVVVPYRPGPESELGPVVNADYFGKLDESRLKVDTEKSLIYFLGDGQMRSKLGLTFARATDTLASWDPKLEVLTVCQYNLPKTAEHGYTNNLWEIQEQPFAGDVINSYNDGPNDSGGMLGPFFELETLSPALALRPKESYMHLHRTIRMEGERSELNRVAIEVLGVSIDEIESQFG